jgi:hypothetical protein
LKALLFSLPAFKYNIIALLTGCILYMKGLDVVRTMSQRWPMQGFRRRSYMSTECELVALFYLQLSLSMMRMTLPG